MVGESKADPLAPAPLLAGSLTLDIAADHPAFAGHFPVRAIVPGVVLLDGAIAVIEAAEAMHWLPGQIGTAKFLHPVGPGVRLRVDYRETRTHTLQIDLFASVDDVKNSARDVKSSEVDVKNSEIKIASFSLKRELPTA